MAWHGQEGQTGLIGLIDRITGPAEADTIVSHPTSYPSLEELFSFSISLSDGLLWMLMYLACRFDYGLERAL